MAATFAGADTVGTVLTSESPAATIAPITIERIASSLHHHPEDLSRLRRGNKPASLWLEADVSGEARRRVGVGKSAPRASISRAGPTPVDREWCGHLVRRFYLARPPAEVAPADQSY